MRVLVIAEHDNQTLKFSTLNTIAAASQISADINVLVAGHQTDKVINSLKNISYIDEIWTVDNEIYSYPLAENLAPLIVYCAKNMSHLFAPATTFGKNIMPRVAALLDVAQISDIIEIVDEHTYRRPIYAGNAIATVESHDPIQVITVRSIAFEIPEQKNNSAKVIPINFKVENQLTSFVNLENHAGTRPELTTADIVISGGRGLQDKANFKRLMAIADRLGAAVGASRAAVDAGLVPNDFQVGQTGQVVAPKLYIAVGISGAAQHLAGMKDSKIIVAINKDPDAPIFKISDYALVADLFEIFPKWEAKLQQMGY